MSERDIQIVEREITSVNHPVIIINDRRMAPPQQTTAMQSYNSELMKCVEELKLTRNNIQLQIEAEEDEKITLQKEVERMTYRISQLNESLAKKAGAKTDYDRTIQETESAYTKILESSQLLLNMVKREATCLDQTLHAVERNGER